MKFSGLPKHLAIGFGLALLLYIVFFSWIEHTRQRKGGWEVTFLQEPDGAPAVVVNQPSLKVTNLFLVFPEERGRLPDGFTSKTLVFDVPRTNVPFGQVLFFDTTFLPGTVTFDFWGHEIELLPRVLGINRQEHVWASNSRLLITNRMDRKPLLQPGVRGKREPRG